MESVGEIMDTFDLSFYKGKKSLLPDIQGLRVPGCVRFLQMPGQLSRVIR